MQDSNTPKVEKVLSGKQKMHLYAREHTAEVTKELQDGFELLSKYPKSVSFFGSHVFDENNHYYKDARTLASRIVKELGYSVVSGGGGGVMEAANRGAEEVGGDSIGLLISIPGEPKNGYLTESIEFQHFFTRKVYLAFGAEVYIFYPGGFGTMDEFFEFLVLIKTGKVHPIPIICVGSEYWNALKQFMEAHMLVQGAVDKDALNLFHITDDHDEILEIMKKVPVQAEVPLHNHKS